MLRHQSVQRALQQASSGREKIQAFLALYAEASHGAEGRRGCMIVGSAAGLATFDEEVATHVGVALRRNEAVLAGLIGIGQVDGSLSQGLDKDATARLLSCLIQGMRVVGKTDCSQADMMALVAIAMKTLD
jgi:hypothetical protein